MRQYAAAPELTENELDGARRIEKNPPVDFLEGSWFEQICDYLGVDAGEMRRGLGAYRERVA